MKETKLPSYALVLFFCSGYLAPEYALGGQLTKKADVYSFGVLVLEIVSGRSSAKENWEGTEKFLLEWVSWFFHHHTHSLILPVFVPFIRV